MYDENNTISNGNSGGGEDNYLPLAFIHLYFELDTRYPEIDLYINTPSNHPSIVNYLNEIGLNFVVGEASSNSFIHITPQFKFVCDRDYNLEIVKFDYGSVYLKKGSVVFATNLFVTNPGDALLYFAKELPSLTNMFTTKQTHVGEKYYVYNGSDGIVFGRSYLDWMGMKVCNGKPYTNDNSTYRMYILGQELVKDFLEKRFTIDTVPFTGVLKNFYKGTPLKRTHNERYVITDKNVTTNNFDVVFDMFEEEFKANKINQIHFVQRDYIFDGKFPSDLLEELQKFWVSDTAVYKVVNKFTKNNVADLVNGIVIDRYAVNGYRKMMVNTEKYVLPHSNNRYRVEHLFVPNDILQFKHTLNAAYVPHLGVVIMATHVFFGARKHLQFTPHTDLLALVKNKIDIKDDTVLYHVGGSYYLEETYFTANDVSIYILVRIDDDLIVRHNLIRTSRKLADLQHNWVLNTILNLFVRKQ
ncbi:p35/p49 [Clostera anastomosis granulovirus B]|uniref:p35/p49 n=1 Tax=Clostera anastomosis granulovirus B TaxID=1986290 RepID=A0A0K0WS28_9BBAC|nr:p35/p49 [Clostera anastomosis granulovirus B]AKS25355.1 p35/p49 [Clostera anastomosis granulovirus B]